MRRLCRQIASLLTCSQACSSQEISRHGIVQLPSLLALQGCSSLQGQCIRPCFSESHSGMSTGSNHLKSNMVYRIMLVPSPRTPALVHGVASAIVCLCLKGTRSSFDSDPPRVDPAPLAIWPIHEMLEAAARFIPSLKETTFLITGTSDQAATATPAVATPAVGKTLRRMLGLHGTTARALDAG